MQTTTIAKTLTTDSIAKIRCLASRNGAQGKIVANWQNRHGQHCKRLK